MPLLPANDNRRPRAQRLVKYLSLAVAVAASLILWGVVLAPVAEWVLR